MSSLSPRTDTPPEIWTESELLQKLHRNVGRAAIITSTDRAARTLRQRYNQRQYAGGHSGWRTPQILAWDPWIETLWDAGILHGLENRVALAEIQELEIWQNILAKDEIAGQTVSTDDLAEIAQKTWKQMHRYRIPLNRLSNDNTLDTASFYRWAKAFEKFCRKSLLLSPSQMEETMAGWIPSEKITLPSEIFLVGFDRITPAQTLLINSLRQRSCDIQFVELISSNDAMNERIIVSAQTVEEEIEAAANWIRSRLLDQPKQQIGVIVPTLETMRGSIDATFRRILAPSSMDIRTGQANLPYEFSLGTPMYRMEMVRTALSLLRWLNHAIQPQDLSWLLVHGGFSGPLDLSRDTRAMLDKKFRERNFQMGGPVSFSVFQQWLVKSGNAPGTTAFRQTMENFFLAGKRAALGKPRSFGEWREIIEQLLVTADWHLLKPTTSADYQLLQRWNALLNGFSSLNGVAGTVRFSTALEKLEYLASHTLFTLQTSNAPVLILGVPESAGLTFDAVWWMNAQTGTWPPRGKALPFLPWAAQCEVHMPYVDPTEDYTFALRTSKRILSSANAVTVSFSIQESDGNASTHIPNPEIVLTPLVRETWPEIPIVTVEQTWRESSQEKVPEKSPRKNYLEPVSEESAVPFQNAEIRGGVRFLELQAACPFRAFAELRLGTRALENPSNGFSPGDQGNLIHRVLDQFWKEMQSRKNLLEVSSEEHRRILRKHIDAALTNFFQYAEEPWQKTLLTIESNRLEQRLMDWLEQEKLRPDFTVIGTEAALDYPQLGGVAFHCRVDRIDRVEQGIALIDYKTGLVDRNSIEGERPDQPQLPAYAVLRGQSSIANESLAGLAFASLHPQNVGFTVIDSLPFVFEQDENPPTDAASRPASRLNPAKLSPSQIQDLEDAWSTTLTRLAEAFRAGAASVDPKKRGETCRYCEQVLLCRIGEAGVLQYTEEHFDSSPHHGSEQ